MYLFVSIPVSIVMFGAKAEFDGTFISLRSDFDWLS